MEVISGVTTVRPLTAYAVNDTYAGNTIEVHFPEIVDGVFYGYVGDIPEEIVGYSCDFLGKMFANTYSFTYNGIDYSVEVEE